MKKVKPTPRQREAFSNIQKGMSKRSAMLAAGYDDTTAANPTDNLIETPGYRALKEEYKKHLEKAGISLEILAEIQAEGLFDQNAGVRLGYVKEAKKDFGLVDKETIGLETKDGDKTTRIIITRGDDTD